MSGPGYKATEADELFKRLDLDLLENIDSQFFSEARDFRSLNEVLEVLGAKIDQFSVGGDANEDLLAMLKDRNPAYSKLLNQRKIVEEVIEDVVKFQHGGLNNSVDTMSEVVREYTRGRDDIQGLRKSLQETQGVLTAKKAGQVPLKELWLKKVELQESLRMVKDLEALKSAPHRIQRLMQQKRYLTAVNSLNKAVATMFGEDLVGVGGLHALREQLMDLKEHLLEAVVSELKEAIVASAADIAGLERREYQSDSESEGDSEGDSSDQRSSEGRSVATRSMAGSVAGWGGMGGGMSSHGGGSIAGDRLRSGHSGGGSIFGSNGGSPGRGELEVGTWTLEMRDLDEALEASLPDPSAEGALFIRLLVRTVGLLECEEDVERMVLEGVADSFLRVSVKAARVSTTARLQKEAYLIREEGEDAILALHTRLFTGFMGTLLDSCLLALKRMSYLLKLLYVGKARRTHTVREEGEEVVVSAAEVARHMREHNTSALVSGWLDMEGLVAQQMLAHLMEPDVQEISDDTQHKLGQSRRSSIGKVGFAMIEERLQEEEESGGLKALIFTPSASHAAPIFRRVVLYSGLASKVLAENSLEDTRNALLTQRTAGVVGTRPAATTLSAFDPCRGHAILSVIDAFLESELLPVIQSTVNATLRELHTTDLFSIQTLLDALPSGGGGKEDEEVFGEVEEEAPNTSRAGATPPREDAILCRAAEMCLGAAKPLFSYWLQLHHNRPMVATVLDRLVRGFASLARAELEGLSFRFVCAKTDSAAATLGDSLRQDPIFRAYRSHVYGAGKLTVDDLFAGTGVRGPASDPTRRKSFFSHRATGTPSSQVPQQPVRASMLRTKALGFDPGFGEEEDGGRGQDPRDRGGRNALESSIWDQLDYWDVGDANYPITSDMIIRDFAAVSTICSISYGCDWIVKKLSGYVTLSTRKIHSRPDAPQKEGAAGIGAAAGMGGAGGRRYQLKGHSEAAENKQQLVSTVIEGSRELSRISEECLALLRGELQVLCFYFLHRLSHVKYTPPEEGEEALSRNGYSYSTALASLDDGTGGEEDAILDAFNEHVRLFFQAVTSSASAEALATMLSPLCLVVPRILTHCAMHIVVGHVQHSTSVSEAGPSERPSEEHPERSPQQDHYLKTHLLRMVVSVQQSTAVHIQHLHIQREHRRHLLDQLTEGFERTRRFINMFDMPAAELRAYLRSNLNDYSKEEVEILWMKSRDSDASFADLWKDLENTPRSAPRSFAARHFVHGVH